LSSWGAALVRLLAVAAALTVIAVAFEVPLARAALGPMRAWLGVIDSSYVSTAFDVRSGGGEILFHREVTPRHPHLVGDHGTLVEPGSQISTNASAGLLLQTFIIGLALCAAWPATRGAREWLARAAVAPALLVLVAAVDLPLLLYAFAWSSELEAAGASSDSPLLLWGEFLQMGGRTGLAALAAGAAILLARRLAGKAMTL